MKNLEVFVLTFLVNVQYGRTGEIGPKLKINIEQISDPVGHANSPYWDSVAQVLYFVSTTDRTFNCYNPRSGNVTKIHIQNSRLRVAVPVARMNNTFVGAAGTDFVKFNWDPAVNSSNSTIEVLARVDVDFNGTRLNHGKVDPKGRFWGGTMGIESKPDLGSLYRIGRNLKPKRMVSPMTMSSGLAWRRYEGKFYYIDSTEKTIWVYDYDNSTGHISNKTILCKLKTSETPGGMTVDSTGRLWIAIIGGGKVIKISGRTGKLLQTVNVPVKQVTNVVFGGPELDILFVTTSSHNLKAEDPESRVLAGSVFAITGIGVHGVRQIGYRMPRENKKRQL